MAFTSRRTQVQQQVVNPIENEKDKATAKRYAGIILGSDEELKALLQFAELKPLMHGIPDTNNNWYYHIKLVNKDKEVIGDIQFCDFTDGKYNNVGIKVGNNYTSYRIGDVRRDLKYMIMRNVFIQQGIIDPNASIVDVEDFESPAEKTTNTTVEEDLPM